MFVKIKKILILILIFYFLNPFSFVLATPESRETATTAGKAYDYFDEIGYDSLKNAYEIRYRKYSFNGVDEGTFYISGDIYKGDNSYYIFIRNNGSLGLYLLDRPDLFSFTYEKHVNTWYFGRGEDWGMNLSYYIYNSDTEQFEIYEEYKNTRFTMNFNTFIERIIYSNHDITVYPFGDDKSAHFSYNVLKSQDVLVVPKLKYMPMSGFRFYLNDFYGQTIELENGSYVDRVLSNLRFYLYDFQNKRYLMENIDVLELRDVEKDSEGRYYIDILFSDLPASIRVEDGDYLLGFTTLLKNTKNFYVNYGVDYAVNEKVYVDTSFYRFHYYSSSGSGILIDSNENGDEDYTPPEPDPNEGVINAIGGLGDSINNQTEAIKENTETNKNIFQKIIELPGKIVELFLDMLKGLFIPHEGFFNEWLDDLNDYFSEAFGILYYPTDLLIDFLNRVSTLNDTGTAIINIPAFKLNFMGHSATVFNSFSYNFNDLLKEPVFKNLHSIYLTIVDVVLWLGVIYLASKCVSNILGGSADTAIPDYSDTEEYATKQAIKSDMRSRHVNLNHSNNMRNNK